MNFELLKKANENNFYLEPFPHLIIENALTREIYENLSNNFPPPHQELDSHNNTIFTVPDSYILEDKKIDDKWKEFLKYLSSSKYFNELNKTLGKCLIEKYSKTFKSIDDLNKLSVSDARENTSTDISSYGRIMFYSPVTKTGIPKKANGSNLEVHYDGPNKLYTSLLYFKDENDKSVGGDLILYKWRYNFPLEIKKLIMARSLNPINFIIRKFQFLFIKKSKTVTYKPNNLVVFVGSEDALHSVGKRNLDSPIRKSVHAGVHFKKNLWDTQSIVDKIFQRFKKK